METPGYREVASDAIRYWEIKRVFYNLALAGVVLIHFFAAWPGSGEILQVDALLGLFLLAVLANVAYCATYIVDIFAQMTGYRELWRNFRWVLFAIGLLFAAVLTHFFSSGIFSAHMDPRR